jgi:hypothetical protein
MKLAWIAWSLLISSSAVTLPACQRHEDGNVDAGMADQHSLDLYHAVCNGKRYCDDFDTRWPYRYLGATIGLTGCVGSDTVSLFGSWDVDDAGSRPFEWKATVRRGGVFPSSGFLAASLGCVNYGRKLPFPGVLVAFEPEGFAGANLGGDDVFIPLQGEATIDHGSRAIAMLDDPADASALHVTVSVEDPGAARTEHRGLGPGDRFSWGAYRATIVQVVRPQEGTLGAIGWVEIKPSLAARDPRDH